DKRFEQKRRRHVQVCCYAQVFQRTRLIGTSAGNESKGRLMPLDYGKLLLAQLLRDKSENADSPGQSVQFFAALGKQTLDLIAAHECQCQERKCAFAGDAVSKTCSIAHPSHRSLHDRVAGGVRARQGRILVENLEGGGLCNALPSAGTKSVDYRSHALILAGQRQCESHVLPKRPQALQRVETAAGALDLAAHGG